MEFIDTISNAIEYAAMYEIKNVPLVGWLAMTYAVKAAFWVGESMTGGGNNIDRKEDIRRLRHYTTLETESMTDERRGRITKKANDLERKMYEDHGAWLKSFGKFALLPTPVDVGWGMYRAGKGIHQKYIQSKTEA